MASEILADQRQTADHPGGVNIFGKGFGNYDQDLIMRLRVDDHRG